MSGFGEKPHGGLIGGGFLGAGIGQQVQLTKLRSGRHDRRACIGRAGKGCDQPHAQRGGHRGQARPAGFAAPDDVGAFDMADLMGDHALDFVWALCANNGAGVEEDVLSAGDEGVELHIADQIEIHCAHIEPRRNQQRVGVFAHGALGLGVPDQALCVSA